MTNSNPTYDLVPVAISALEYEITISSLQATIATLKNDSYDLRAKLMDRDREIAELKGVTQDILVAAGELVRNHARR